MATSLSFGILKVEKYLPPPRERERTWTSVQTTQLLRRASNGLARAGALLGWVVEWRPDGFLIVQGLGIDTYETFCLAKRKGALPNSLAALYIYPYYPRIVISVFLRENPSKYTWELEIVIPTIVYTFPLGFPLLLPLHLYILERFLAQTLTAPNLSVEWSFGTAGKHLKEPFSGGCNRVELRIWKAREDKTPRSLLVAGAGRAHVQGVD